MINNENWTIQEVLYRLKMIQNFSFVLICDCTFTPYC